MMIIGAGNGYWLPHDINEVIWGTIAFTLVATVLVRKAGPAIRKAMVGRTERIQAEMDAAAALRTGAEAELDQVRTALATTDDEGARIVAEATATAEKLRVDLAERTEIAIAALRERAAADLTASRRQAESDLAAEVSRLALGAAEQVVHQNLDDPTQQGLIEAYIASVGSTN